MAEMKTAKENLITMFWNVVFLIIFSVCCFYLGVLLK